MRRYTVHPVLYVDSEGGFTVVLSDSFGPVFRTKRHASRAGAIHEARVLALDCGFTPRLALTVLHQSPPPAEQP